MTFSPLEHPPRPQDQAFDRRWRRFFVGLLGVFIALTVYRLYSVRNPYADQPTETHSGPLPDKVRQQVLASVAPFLQEAVLLEEQQAGVRVFILKGTPRTALAQDFNRAFNPLVVQTLIPLLKPYGEVLSFDIASLDPPPVRLNPFG
ncbi:MAG: hypothetical protein ACKN9J_02150 [Holophagaceae bacterium]